jgi:Rhodopirellula transposase DDE domain
VLQTIRHLLIRSGCFRLERELPGGVCTHDICAPWQGTQWNRIEHKLFAFITMNWRAKPLVSYLAIIQLIAGTTTETGLTVACQLDSNIYEKGIRVSDEEMASLNVKPDSFHGEWNYTIAQRRPDG